MKLGCLLARKGCVEKMQYYWDVGFYLGAQILANDLTQVALASEQLYKLNAPIWEAAPSGVLGWPGLSASAHISPGI